MAQPIIGPDLAGYVDLPPEGQVQYTRAGVVTCVRMDGPFDVRERASVNHIEDGWLCRGEDGYLFGVEDAVFADQFAVVTYLITPTFTGSGSIDPSVPQDVANGSDQSFTITADEGFVLDEMLIDLVPTVLVGPVYTFTNVQAPHAIHVTFVAE